MLGQMRIARVVRVTDTREYEEGPDGRFRPIPGSGTEHECARCGRMHEVHALVELEDGTTVIVGTGCAVKADTRIKKEIASVERAAKRRACMEAEMDAIESRLAAWDREAEAVRRLVPGPIYESTRKLGSREMPILVLDDQWMSTQFAMSVADIEHIKRELRRKWRDAQIARKAGITRTEMERDAERYEKLSRQL